LGGKINFNWNDLTNFFFKKACAIAQKHSKEILSPLVEQMARRASMNKI
jgi:hypothetical protein